MTQGDFELVLGEVCRAFAAWPRKEVKEAYWHTLKHYPVSAVRSAIKEIQDDPDVKRLPSPVEIARRVKTYTEASTVSHRDDSREDVRRIIERHISQIMARPVMTAAMERKLECLRNRLLSDYAYTGAGHAGDMAIE